MHYRQKVNDSASIAEGNVFMDNFPCSALSPYPRPGCCWETLEGGEGTVQRQRA